jgi:hypothetical protein
MGRLIRGRRADGEPDRGAVSTATDGGAADSQQYGHGAGITNVDRIQFRRLERHRCHLQLGCRMLNPGIAEDVILRSFGYRILSRPNRGEAVWILPSGIQHLQSEALRHVIEWRLREAARANK